nr:iron-containing alcohol dehydrogenase [Clostridiales bacterium]
MDFNFFMPVKVVSGNGALIKNSALLRALGSRCLIVTTKTAYKTSGAMADVEACFKNEGIEFTLYNDIGQNPHIDKCYEASLKA